MNQKNYLIGLLMLAALACLLGCGNNKSSKSKVRPIWEYRTERYLERVATEADLSLREAQEIYREACEKQSAADSVSAKDTIRLYEARYVEAKERLEEAWSHVDRWYEYDEDYEMAYAKYEELSKSFIVTIEIYERAMEVLRTARGEMVRVAKADLDDVESARMKIATYRDILNTPSEEWTQEDSVSLDHIYKFCRKAESEGWGYNISTRLVRYMQELK
jgi:tetratricopeptide (TPR) repeat protein